MYNFIKKTSIILIILYALYHGAAYFNNLNISSKNNQPISEISGKVQDALSEKSNDVNLLIDEKQIAAFLNEVKKINGDQLDKEKMIDLFLNNLNIDEVNKADIRTILLNRLRNNTAK